MPVLDDGSVERLARTELDEVLGEPSLSRAMLAVR